MIWDWDLHTRANIDAFGQFLKVVRVTGVWAHPGAAGNSITRRELLPKRWRIAGIEHIVEQDDDGERSGPVADDRQFGTVHAQGVTNK